MEEFKNTTTNFLSKRPLCDSICAFNDILREEQIKRQAHISCLPCDVVSLILYMAEGSTINIHRNISKYMSIIGKNQIDFFREQTHKLSRRWLKLEDMCRSLLEMNSHEEFPMIILAQTDKPAGPYTGTNIGRHILCILEKNHKELFKRKKGKYFYKFNICENAVANLGQNMTVSAHKCALVAHNKINPFHGAEEFVAIQSNKVHKIWWVKNTADNIFMYL